MSLLDDVSIVVTPNGYKAGELYAVIPVPSEGAEEVTNGDFATDSDWTKGTGWTISGGSANSDGANSFSSLSQASVLTIGKRYKLIVDINLTSGQLRIQEGGAILETYTTTGANTATYYFIATATNITFKTSVTPFNGSIDNVSVKEWVAADMDVTRATDATRVDENGLIEKLGANVPRIDYTGGGCPHILAEPQRTNLMTTSEPTTTGSFKTGVVFQATHIFDWNGIYYGDNSVRRIAFFNSATTVGVDVTFSVFVKMTNGNAPTVGTSSSDDFKMYISSAITTGLTIVNIGGGIYKCSVTKSASSINSLIAIEKVVGNSANTFEVSGFQMEAGSYATSYIPTSGSTVTRNQDIFTRDGIGSLINSTEGVLFVEMAALDNDGSYRVMTISDGTTANYIALYYSPTTNNISWELKVGGAAQFSRSVSLPLGSTSFNKFAFKYKENDCKLFLNGVESDIYTSNATFTSNTLNSLFLTNGLGALKLFGKVKQLQVYDTALTDDQLRQITQ